MPKAKEILSGTANQIVSDGDLPRMLKITGVGSEIWVHADYGDDTFGNGTYLAPYKTLVTAWAQLTAARNIIQLMPTTTEYVTTATLTFPAYEVFIQGQGDPDMAAISAGASVTPLFSIAPGAVGATLRQAHFSNMLINHGETSQIGIQVTNLNADGKILIWIQNVAMEGDSGNAIDVDHPTDGAASSVKLFAKGNSQYIEGNINWDCGGYSLGAYGGGDRVNFDSYKLEGTFTLVGDADTTPEIQVWNCQIPANAWATFTTTTTAIISMLGCSSKDGMTFAPADTTDIAGTATEVFTPTS